MPMSTLEVGKKLVELCSQLKNLEAVDTLYAQDVSCIEAMSMPGMPAKTEGFAAIRAKNEKFMSEHTIHSVKVTGPWPNGDRFIAYMEMDVTAKAGPMAGQRMNMQEAALYTVKDGKITKEEFFYSMGG